MKSAAVLGVCVLLGGSASAQQWRMDIPGAVGDEFGDHETLRNLELHPSGEVIGVGLRDDNENPTQAIVLRVGLDGASAQLRQYQPPLGTKVSLADLTFDGDDTLVACGRSGVGGLNYAWLVSVDRDSDTIHWECSPTSTRSRLYRIARVADGYVACGVMFPEAGGSNAYVVKVDLSGDVLWQHEIQRPGGVITTHDVQAAPDGGAYVTGYSDGGACFLRFAADGTLLRSVRYQGASDQRHGYIAPAQGGGYFVAATHLDPVSLDHQTWVARITEDGQNVWQYRYRMLGGTLDEVRATADGGCLVVGTRGVTGDARPSGLRLDGDGEVLWCRSYDIAHDSQYTFNATGVPLPDGGAVIGTTVTGGGLESRVSLLRVGSDGELDNGCGQVDTEVLVSRQATAMPLVHMPIVTSALPESFETLTTTPSLLAMESSIVCGEPCAAPVPYCVFSPNSVGPGAAIGSIGSTSIAANDFGLTATALPPSTPGVFFYGTAQTETPFQDGTLCVAAPSYRLGTVSSFVTGDAFRALDWNALPPAAPQALPGSRFFFQLWYRDNAGGPAGSNLSNGLDVSFCP